MTTKKKNDETTADQPDLPGLKCVQLVDSIMLGKKDNNGKVRPSGLNGTVQPGVDPNHEGIELFDAGRFLEMRRDGAVTRVPWSQTRYHIPLDEE